MAALRKASAYSKRNVHAYTRISKKKGKAYIKTVPPQKIVKFAMGATKSTFPHKLTVVSDEDCQIRDCALEATRQYIHKNLDESLSGQYIFRVVPFPHHIQRENKMLTGAGSDRMSKGMQLAFGRAIGKAAIIKRNASLFIFELPDQKAIQFSRSLINQIRSKLPCRIRVIYTEKK